MRRADDLIHSVRAEEVATPAGGAQQQECLNVREAEHGIGLARFCGGQELQRGGEFFLVLLGNLCGFGLE